MPTVTFKAKPQQMHSMEGVPLYEFVQIPKTLGSKHCDMHAFRTHKRYSAFANSDMFSSMLARALTSTGLKPGSLLRLDQVPENVSVDTSKFLIIVSINLE